MKRSYVILARALAYMDIDEMDPTGKASLVDIVKAVSEHYRFKRFPIGLEDFDRSKGVEFGAGVAGDTPIQRLAIFDTLLLVETRSNTTDAKDILLAMLIWASEKFGLNFHPGTIRHWGYISSVVFKSDPKLLNVHPAVDKICDRVTDLVGESWNQIIQYKPIRVSMGHDPEGRKYPIAPFTIERKAQTAFSENQYFSEAPIPTHLHWNLLEEFEREVLHEPNVETH